MSLRVESDGPTTVVTITRLSVRNAVDFATASELFAAFRAIDEDDDCRVAILTGEGGTFCAGADLGAVATSNGNRVDVMAPEATGEHVVGPMGPTRMQLSKPVIAAVEGYAVAGGLELALWCDLRVAARDATFGVFCRRWGVPLVDGGTVRLPRIVGQGRAMDMILTGRPVGAPEALDWGLVNRISEPGAALDDALVLAEQIAAFPQVCARSDRRSSLEQWALPEHEALARETVLGLETIASGETLEGAARFASGEGRHGSF
ncbi:crotonase/enoyl-CoA hydratase family protein [Actinospongicola halichondriae]|uniref:crotonase/enoyl-CoA hydratase family protein n=1 Tax=Actinospongicola halichondriae TaxID=3236844 RepID=UPI003D38F40D